VSHTPADSAIKLSKELEEQILNAPTSQIGEILRAAAVDQGLVRRDIYSPDILIPVDQPTPQRFAERVTVNGKTVIVEADSQDALNRAVIEAYKSGQAQPQAQPQPQPTRNPNNGQFTRNVGDDVLENLLSARGISLSDLQEASNRAYTQSWAEASSQFVAENALYEGGEINMRLIGERLIQKELQDAPDKTKAISDVYAELKAEGRIIPNADAERLREYEEAVMNSNDPLEIAELSRQFQRG
jgi:hypothetical protein